MLVVFFFDRVRKSFQTQHKSEAKEEKPTTTGKTSTEKSKEWSCKSGKTQRGLRLHVLGCLATVKRRRLWMRREVTCM
jgi:hypothetical protein